MKHNLRLSILFVLTAFVFTGTAQVTKLSNNSNLEEGFPLGSIGVMISATDSLWKTDATAVGTMKYANNVSTPSRELAFFNNKIYFAGTDAANGEELWVTDGITASLVANIETGNTSSSPQNFTVFNNTIYFFATTGAEGTELWKSNGTGGGTVIVKDINPTGNSFDATSTTFFENNGILYFVATNGTDGVELWKTDGTGPNTVMVSNINPTGSSNPGDFFALGNEVLFSADDGTNGRELWKTDGTTTSLVKNIATDPTVGSSPSQFMLFNGKVYFTTTIFDLSIPAFNSGIYVTDGTTVGTTLVKDGFNSPLLLLFSIFMNNKFYFTGSTDADGSELWSSDGTPANTQIFMDINPTGDASPILLPDFIGATTIQDFHTHLYNGKIFFRADDGTNGAELWITDGTVLGTKMVKDIDPGGDGLGSSFTWFYSQSGLYFTASNGTDGNELWKSDGTLVGTNMVIDLNTSGDSDPEFMMLLNQQLLFTADDGDNINGDRDLYKLDGTFISLPLQLLTFTAAPAGKSVELNWLTSTEINTSHFEIERSKDGQHFDKIGGLNAANLQQRNTYRFNDIDALLLGTDKLFYRLKLFDKDGKFTYSKVEVVNVKASAAFFFSYPNPTHNQLKVMVNSPIEQKASLQIIDVNGKRLFNLPVKNLRGANQYNINVSSYPNGTYYIQVITNGERKSIKFIKE